MFKFIVILFLSFYLEASMEKPYGTWESPISAELVTKGAKRFGSIHIDEDQIYWDEMRPSEQGRSVIVSEKGTLTPPGYSVRTRVYEYGGKAFTVRKGTLYFVNDRDQRIYIQKGDLVTPLTDPGVRFGDLQWSALGLIAIGEKGQENFIALIDFNTGNYKTLASGHDFYNGLALSSDEKKLAWISWDLPDMPWDGNELWVADLEKGSLKNERKLAGGPQESIFQPQWSPKGILYYVSDKSGWWNLYSQEGKNLLPKEAEFGLPQWILGMSTYGFVGEQILCTYFESGQWKLTLLNPQKSLDLPATLFRQIRTGNTCAAFLQGSPLESTAVVRLDLKTRRETLLAANEKPAIDSAYFSRAEPISYPSKGGRIAHAFYYPPTNKDYVGPKGTLPPLIVEIHGGPTAQVTGDFSLHTQYWTSRGFAVLDVNYGGSTGYGRVYREQLNGMWGIVDVEDCEYGAKYLVEKGLVDPKKLAITGGSAGGYTTLAALTFGKTFTVGASYYGVSDLAALAKETHKFESRYLDNLVGPYPERSDLYTARSPITFPEKITSPVIFFQGDEDKIVPLDQAEMMYEALKKRGIETKLIVYKGEQHGFRKAENIQNSLEEELAFYLKSFR